MRRPSMRTVTALAVAAAFGLAALPAGSASAATSRATSLPPCPLSALAKAQHPVQITAWHALTQANATALQNLTNQFNSSQSQVHVTLVNQASYNDTQTKFVAGLSTGDLPDVAQIQDTGLQQMIDSHAILPVQSCVNADHYTSQLSDFIPRTLSYWTVKGVLEGMPFNVSNPVFFYNKAAFTKAGLDPNSPPATLAQVMADAQKLKASGAVSQAGFGLKTDPSDLEEWIAKSGAPYVNNGNGRSARATKATFDSPAGQAVFQWMSQMVKQGLAVVNNDENTEAYNNLIGIGNGNQAMTIDTSATLGTITQLLNSGQYPGVDLGVSPMPSSSVSTGPGGVLVGGAAFYIVNKSSPAKQAAAWEYLKFLDSPQTQATFAAGTGYVPIRKSSVTLPAIQQLWAKIPGYKVAYEQLVNGPSNVATAGPVIGDYISVRNAVRNAEEAMFSSGVNSKAALAQAQTNATAAIQAYNARVGG
jgi:sn-glycerol 3-phosphate transport system substrate-binding protein